MPLYFENFSSLFDENPSATYDYNFEKFEEMVQKCASAAVRDVRLAWTNNKVIGRDIDINISMINKVIASYKQSSFGKDWDDSYIMRVRDEFVFLIWTELRRSCHNQKHYDLILPVIFFRCIMQNEFNPASVKNRVTELKDYQSLIAQEVELQGLSDDDLDDLYLKEEWINRRSPWIKTFESGEVLGVKLYQLEDNEKSFYELISEAERLAIKANFNTNEAIPQAVRIACNGFFPLKDKYELVKSCSEYARVGCFLYDLLEATSDSKQPLDTILRLYMIAEIHKVLNCTGYIIRGEAYLGDTKSKERPLLRFNNVKEKS